MVQVQRPYPYLVPPDLQVADAVSVVAAHVVAVAANGHLVCLAVQQPQVAAADRGGLQVRGDVRLAAAGVAAQAHLLRRRVAAVAAAERVVGRVGGRRGRVVVGRGRRASDGSGGGGGGGRGHGGGVGRERVELLHDVAEFEVLLQGRLLRASPMQARQKLCLHGSCTGSTKTCRQIGHRSSSSKQLFQFSAILGEEIRYFSPKSQNRTPSPSTDRPTSTAALSFLCKCASAPGMPACHHGSQGKTPVSLDWQQHLLHDALLGCVLIPLLYSVYTYDCMAEHSSDIMFRFAGDTTVVGPIKAGYKSAYRREIEILTEWCHNNNLLLDVSKTKQLIIDSKKRKHEPVLIKGSEAERVIISEDLYWT
ncbi:uncharacterized protein LOC134341296 [Mobula hypostoma]|uniref:uncharacterized protein LOC134341296 n=1 Tax=Mobula hypostoma TaxID=723540 RepID=UPI002FC3407B